MRHLLRNVLVCTLALLCVSAAATAGDAIELRFADGSRWKGSTDDPVVLQYRHAGNTVEVFGRIVRHESLYVVVDGTIGGLPSIVTIFKTDLVAVRNAEEGETISVAAPVKPTRTAGPTSRPSDVSSRPVAASTSKGPCVFVLPLDGMVGTYIRHEEIEAIGEEADKVGQGQIIVLLINTNGGLAAESEVITDTIFELRKRHRVIAWIKKAISAGCQTAMSCSEIYFMTEGSAGAVTTHAGGVSIKGEDLERSMEHLAKVAERSGYSRFIAYSMKTNSAICSYDKDPQTGEITWYNDLSGEHVLSDDDSNLSFTSSSALHCGFSKGTADTVEELATLLDMPEWCEVNDYGRQLAGSWQSTIKKAEERVPRLMAQRGYKNTGGGPEERIGALIKIDKELLQWWDRCPTVMLMNGIAPEEDIKREIKELQKQLADMRRR